MLCCAMLCYAKKQEGVGVVFGKWCADETKTQPREAFGLISNALVVTAPTQAQWSDAEGRVVGSGEATGLQCWAAVA